MPITPLQPMKPMSKAPTGKQQKVVGSQYAAPAPMKPQEPFVGDSLSINTDTDPVKGWAKQQVDDFTAIFTGFPTLVGLMYKGIADVPKNMGILMHELARDPQLVLNSTTKVLGDVLHAATDHYRDQKSGEISFGSVGAGLRDRTFLAALDALTIASLGGGAAAKIAQFSGKGAAVAKAAGKLGTASALMSTTKKLSNLSATLHGIGNMPYTLAGKAIAAIEKTGPVRSAENFFGLGPRERDLSAKLGSYILENTTKESDLLRKDTFKVIPPEKWDKLNRTYSHVDPLDRADWTDNEWSAIVGDAERNAASKAEFEKLGVHYNSGRINEASNRAADIKHTALALRAEAAKAAVARGKMKPANIDKLLAKRFSKKELLKAEEHYEGILATSDALGTGDVHRHTFRGFMEEATHDPVSDLHSFLEPRLGPNLSSVLGFQKLAGPKGKANLVNDPALWQARQRMAKARAAAHMRWLNELIEEVGHPVKNDFDLARLSSELGEEMVMLPDMYLKALPRKEMAESLLLKRVLEHGADSPDALRKALGAAAQDILEMYPAFEKDLASVKFIGIPKATARLIKEIMEPPDVFHRSINKLTDFWRAAVLFTPRMLVNNYLGNAILSILHGTLPPVLKGSRLKNIPAEMDRIGALWEIMEQNSVIDKIWQPLRNGMNKASSATDTLARARAYDHDLMDVLSEKRTLDRISSSFAGPEDMKALDTMLKASGTLEQLVNDARKATLAQGGEKLGAYGKLAEPRLRLQRARKEQSKLANKIEQFDEMGYDTASLESKLELADQDYFMAQNEIRAAAEKLMQTEPYRAQMKILAEPVERSIKSIEGIFGNYGRAHPFARKYMRTYIPFWTFTKTMFNLAFRLPFLRPKTTWMWHNVSKFANDMFEDDDMPETMRGMLFTGYTFDGKPVFARVGGFNPFDSMGVRTIGGIAAPRGVLPIASPLFTFTHRMLGGRDFFENPVPLQGGQVMFNNGQVFQWDAERNEWFKTTPETPFLDALFELIPHTAMMNDILAAHGVRMPGQGPKLLYGPNGELLNPRHWSWAIMRSIGTPFEAIDVDQRRTMELVRKRNIIRELVKKVKYSRTPGEREQFMKIAYDILNHPDWKVTSGR